MTTCLYICLVCLYACMHMYTYPEWCVCVYKCVYVCLCGCVILRYTTIFRIGSHKHVKSLMAVPFRTAQPFCISNHHAVSPRPIPQSSSSRGVCVWWSCIERVRCINQAASYISGAFIYVPYVIRSVCVCVCVYLKNQISAERVRR